VAAVARAGAPWRETLADAAAIVVLWLLFAAWVGRNGPVAAYDGFRDMAYAHAIQHGRLWDDPSLPGFRAWYPPGNPMLFAALSTLSRIPVVDLYLTSLYWLGWLNPVLLYLLVRATWGRGAAWAALPLVFLGSFWWLIHAAMPMPSVQGVALGLGALLAWTRALRGGWWWTFASGAVTALAIWYHPLCGAMALGSITAHGLLAPLLGRRDDDPAPRGAALLLRAIAAAGVALALAAPLLLRQLAVPRGNAAPHHWFAPELHDLRYALHLHAPLVVPLGLIGLSIAVRRWRTSGWLAAYFALGLAAEIAGYAGHDLGWKLPWIIPHEFQWHEQLALLIAAAAAVSVLSQRLAARARSPQLQAVRLSWAAGLLAVAVGPALPSLPLADSYVLRFDRGWSSMLATAAWVRASTPFDAVFACDPEAGFYLSGLTGRKCLALPPGHMNPASDVETRYRDLREMLTTPEEEVFRPLAVRYGATYLLAIPARGTARTARAVYGAWTCLEPANLSDSSALVYRIRTAAAR
jgi:hypothetical protein